MSFSPKVLANIKQANDSDEDEQEYSLLKPMKTPPTETATVIEPIEEILPRSEDFKEDLEINVDPLFSNMEAFCTNSFIGAYKNSEIIKTDESDDDEDIVINLQNKRKRFPEELVGRNGFIWSTSKPALIENFDSALQLLQPKGKGPAHTINNILEMWSLLVDEQIVSQIVHYTNLQIKQRKTKLPHQRLIDAVELRAWIGLNYLCGIFRNATHSGPLDELWSIELGNAIFRATMSLKRFKFISESLRFGNNIKQDKKQETDGIMDIWNKFLVNCRSYYSPSGNCSVAEVVMNFTNVKDVPRLLLLCDVKTLYMCNAVLNSSGEYKDRDVLRLASDIKGSKRNIVLSSQYTSVELAKKLLDMELSTLGSLPRSAKEIPPEFISNSCSIRKLYSKYINLISSQPNIGILLTCSVSNKVKAEHLYNLSCNACRNYQEIAGIYSTSHATQPIRNCWSLTFFQNILDYAIVNAWILFVLSSNGDGSIKQRDFQRHLGLYLTQQQLKRQLQSNRLTIPQKAQIAEVLGEPTSHLFVETTAASANDIAIMSIPHDKLKLPDGVKLLPKNLKTRHNCRKCPSKISRKTKTRCQQCLRPLCQRHFVLRCCDCSGVIEADLETQENANEIGTEQALSDSDREDGQDDSDIFNLP